MCKGADNIDPAPWGGEPGCGQKDEAHTPEPWPPWWLQSEYSDPMQDSGAVLWADDAGGKLWFYQLQNSRGCTGQASYRPVIAPINQLSIGTCPYKRKTPGAGASKLSPLWEVDGTASVFKGAMYSYNISAARVSEHFL